MFYKISVAWQVYVAALHRNPERVCRVLRRSGCWRGATWRRGRPRPRAGWRRRRATSPCALLRASCAVSGPSRALAHSCRSAGLLTAATAPCRYVSCSTQFVLLQVSQLLSLQLPAAPKEHLCKLPRSILQALDPVQNPRRTLLNLTRIVQEGGQRRRDAAQEIAAASLVAAVEIYSSMEAAAQLVLEGGSTAASDIAGHK